MRYDEYITEEFIDEIQESSANEIAVIGISTRFPYAEDHREFWGNLENGKCCVGEFPHRRRVDIEPYLYDINDNPQKDSFSSGCYLEDIDQFDYGYFKLSHSEAQSMDPSQRIFLEQSISAMEDAGYNPNFFRGTKTGVYVGHGIDSGYRQFLKEADSQLYSISVPGNLRSMIPRRLSYLLNLRGPSVVFDTACSSSLVAIHYACQALRSGECDMAIAGSVKFNLMPQKDEDKFNVESVDGLTRSFDNDATGFGVGEGAVVLILKTLSLAVKHHDHIYSVIKGSAINQDGASIGITAPSPRAQEEVIVKAWLDADINPQQLSYIEAHGTGTNLGDPIEIDGLQKAFARYTTKKQFCAIGSVKTNIGHLDHASGISGLVKAILALKEKKIPASLHFHRPNKKLLFPSSPLYVNDTMRYWESVQEKRICAVSSFGFSGTNCHMVVEEPPARKMLNRQKNAYSIFCISAKNVNSLNGLIKKYRQYFCRDIEEDIEDICYTVCVGREHHRYRLAIIAKDCRDLAEKLLKTGELEEQAFQTEDIFYSGKITAASDRYKDISHKTDSIGRLEEKHIELIREICSAYVDGENILWSSLYHDTHLKVSLPTYAFEKNRCWPEYQWKSRRGIRNEMADTKEIVENGMGTAREKITQVWKSVLGIKEESYTDTFEELGGNSILAIKMEVELKKRGIQISSEDILKNGSLGSLLGTKKEDYKCQKNSVKNTEQRLEKNTGVVINGLEPFNDFFFKNCFYNSAFPVVRYYNKSILPFLINHMVLYRNDENDDGGMRLQASYSELLPMEKLLASEAYTIQTTVKSADIVADIRQGIDALCPVILWIDSYYEPQRADTYGKVHRDHTLLVYGYDDLKQIFHIIEHGNMDNLDYAKREINYEDLIRCYRGYLINYGVMDKKPTVYKLFSQIHTQKNTNTLNADDKTVFLKNVNSNKDALLENSRHLRDFKNHFDELFCDKAKLDTHIENSVQKLNNIMNSKRVQLYVVKALFEQSTEAVVTLEKIIAGWDKIRSVTLWYYYSRRYKKADFQELIESINDIVCMEDKLNAFFINEAVLY